MGKGFLAPQGMDLTVSVTDASGNISTQTFFPQFLTGVSINLREEVSVKAFLSQSLANSFGKYLYYDIDYLALGGSLNVSGLVLVDKGKVAANYTAEEATALAKGRNTIAFLLGAIKPDLERVSAKTVSQRPLQKITLSSQATGKTHTFNRCRCQSVEQGLLGVGDIILHRFSISYHFETNSLT